MEVCVYNGEHFDRRISWFIGFAIGLAVVIGVSLRYMNLFGAILMFLIAGGYILFSLTKNKHINLAARDTGLVVDTRLRPRQNIESFVVEVEQTAQERKNVIIILKNHDTMIFTFDDTQDNKKTFVKAMEEYIPLIETAPLSSIDKLVRRLKL